MKAKHQRLTLVLLGLAAVIAAALLARNLRRVKELDFLSDMTRSRED